MTLSAAALAVLTASLLAACSGGGGGSNPTPVGSTPTPAPSVAASASPHPSPSAGTGTQATATGTVVDYAANTPLSGVKVSISAYTAGSAITQVATTTSTGTFSFTTAPGTYYLVIGSDSPTDTTTTLHTKITLAAGNNALTLPIPPAETDVTYTAAQLSGNFRLTALSGNQLSCFTGQNAGRTSASLPQEIPEELMTEAVTAEVNQSVALNGPGSLDSSTFYSFETSIGGIASNLLSTAGYEPSCPQLTDTFDFNSADTDVYPTATNASNIYFGANALGSGTDGYAAQAWAADPR
jgi:hypothetical protein